MDSNCLLASYIVYHLVQKTLVGLPMKWTMCKDENIAYEIILRFIWTIRICAFAPSMQESEEACVDNWLLILCKINSYSIKQNKFYIMQAIKIKPIAYSCMSK